jgi:hypothetical protein
MKRLLEVEYLKVVFYSYDTIEEWNDEYKEMLNTGWEDAGNFHDNGKYYQKYSRRDK